MGWTRGENGRRTAGRDSRYPRDGGEARKTETTMIGLHEERFGNSGRGMVNKTKRYRGLETVDTESCARKLRKRTGRKRRSRNRSIADLTKKTMSQEEGITCSQDSC